MVSEAGRPECELLKMQHSEEKKCRIRRKVLCCLPAHKDFAGLYENNVEGKGAVEAELILYSDILGEIRTMLSHLHQETECFSGGERSFPAKIDSFPVMLFIFIPMNCSAFEGSEASYSLGNDSLNITLAPWWVVKM